MIVGHCLHGMGTFYIVKDEEALRVAMDKFTDWFDKQLDTVNITKPFTQKKKTN